MFDPWKKSYDNPSEHIKKQRHYFANKGPSSQGYGFSSSHVWMWELDCRKSWALKNQCFWTVVLEKTLESPLDCKEIQPVNPTGNQSWIFIGRTDAETEAPILWPPDAKNQLIGKDPDAGKDWRQDEKGTAEYKVLSSYIYVYITDSVDMSLSKVQEFVIDKEAWHAAVHGVTASRTWQSDWTLSWARLGWEEEFLSYWLHCCRGSGKCDSGLQMPLQDCCACKHCHWHQRACCHMHLCSWKLGIALSCHCCWFPVARCLDVAGRSECHALPLPMLLDFLGLAELAALAISLVSQAPSALFLWFHHLCESQSTHLLMCSCVEFSRALVFWVEGLLLSYECFTDDSLKRKCLMPLWWGCHFSEDFLTLKKSNEDSLEDSQKMKFPLKL